LGCGEGDISMFCFHVGKDVLAKAKTGTGKTVAFLVLLLVLQSLGQSDVIRSS
jgi:superfamily II DNA/RNA helicase